MSIVNMINVDYFLNDYLFLKLPSEKKLQVNGQNLVQPKNICDFLHPLYQGAIVFIAKVWLIEIILS